MVTSPTPRVVTIAVGQYPRPADTEDMSPKQPTARRLFAFLLRALNEARRGLGLPSVRAGLTRRETLRQIAVEVWSKYNGALTRDDFTLGEFTLALVTAEIEQRISDIDRGVNIKSHGFVRTPFHGGHY